MGGADWGERGRWEGGDIWGIIGSGEGRKGIFIAKKERVKEKNKEAEEGEEGQKGRSGRRI